MHIGLIIDEERLMHEHIMLNRLSIGLIDEGAQLTRLVPEEISIPDLDLGEHRVALATRVAYPARVPLWMHRRRAQNLIKLMEKSTPDVLYAVGEYAWQLGMDLAKWIECPLALDVWTSSLIPNCPTGRAAQNIAAYIVSTNSVSRLLSKKVDSALISTIPIGVPLPGEPRKVLAELNQFISIAVIGSGRDLSSYRTVLTSLKQITQKFPQVQIFLELRGSHSHDIWRLAQELELLPVLSTITDAAQHRQLLLHCDVFILPERTGRMRSLLLEAMALGLVVIAHAEPALELLGDQKTSALVKKATVEAWTNQVLQLLRHPDEARQLGESARDYVSNHHRSSQHVTNLMETFDKILHGGALSFVAS